MTLRPAVRRGAIFGGALLLGLVLVALLADRGARPTGARPVIEVVVFPRGASLGGGAGSGGLRLLDAASPESRPVREIALADGTRIRYSAWTVKAASATPLPPRGSTERVALEAPHAVVRRKPATREEAADPDRDATILRATRGVFEQEETGRGLLRLEDEVRARLSQRGEPWDVFAADALADVDARTLESQGPVRVESRGLFLEGTGLRAAGDPRRSAVIPGGASGRVERTGGARLGGGEDGAGEADQPIAFSCKGPLHLEELPDRGDARERFRVVLETAAEVRQGDASLSAERIEIEVSRPAGGRADVERILATGDARFRAGEEGGRLSGTAREVDARPLADGRTEVAMRGSPRIAAEDAKGALDLAGEGDATFVLPREAGRVEMAMGRATAVRTTPGVGGAPPTVRRLRGGDVRVLADRDAKGRMDLVSMLADGDAEVEQTGRRAAGRRLQVLPREGGGFRFVMEGDASASIPASGALDPLAAGAPATGPSEGTLFIRTPGRISLELPPDEDTAAAPVLSGDGGVVVSRVAGEREEYRLAAREVRVILRPGTREVERLAAEGAATFTGRGRGPAATRYDLRGESIEVTTLGGASDSGEATLRGPAPGERASARFEGEDGRPLRLEARTIVFDRRTGRFRADDETRAEGILQRAATPGAPAGGTASLHCASLEGVVVRGAEGLSRLRGLDAKGPVLLRCGSDEATGDRVSFDESEREFVFAGAPARLRLVPMGAPPGSALRDSCEAPVLRIAVGEGRVDRARAPDGARMIHHVIQQGRAVERISARCDGPLEHTPDVTTLLEGVSLAQAREEKGAFAAPIEAENLRSLRLEHPGGGPLRAAEALGGEGGAIVRNGAKGWTATGVAASRFDPATSTLALDAAAGSFLRVAEAGRTQRYRRCVFDTTQGILKESVGGVVEGEGR